MQAHGTTPSTVYNSREADAIHKELNIVETAYLMALYDREDGTPLEMNSADYLLKVCRQQSQELANFLQNFCLDPSIDLEAVEADDWSCAAPYFTGTYSALLHFKNLSEAEDVNAVTTSIGETINATLDYGLQIGRMVIIEGSAGSGKTHAAEAWARRHPAQARFVSPSGITHRTGFFQRLAASVGLATSQRKSCELQAKVKTFFADTKLMLVIDEAHFLWPQAKRVYTNPELVDWVNTALVNQGVPVALICTDQFARLKERVEKQTGWTSEQLMHRIKRYTKLPDRPTEQDLETVTRTLLLMTWDEATQSWSGRAAKCDVRTVKLIVGYALLSRLPLASVRDAIDESRSLARAARRDRVLFEDANAALEDYQIPSDAAMKQAFECKPQQLARVRTLAPSKAFLSKEQISKEQMSNSVAQNHPAYAPIEPFNRITKPQIKVS